MVKQEESIIQKLYFFSWKKVTKIAIIKYNYNSDDYAKDRL